MPEQLSPSMMELAWLQLAMADPRTLSPSMLQILSEMHQALNQRQRRDPYGIIPMTPPGPSYLQEWYRFQQQHPPQPFRETFPRPNWESPFVGKDSQPKTGVEFGPKAVRWGI